MMLQYKILLLTLFISAFMVRIAAFSFSVRTSPTKQYASSRSNSSLRMSKNEEKESDVKEEKSKVKKGPTWMYNKNGVAYAPWMVNTFDPENLEKIEAALEARRVAKSTAVAESVGDLARDPQAMELSGLGLNLKAVNGEVELEWKTGDETRNKGFIISKRAGKSTEWIKIASYEDWAPLNSKGPNGGVYTFIDPQSEEGTWIYRVSDVSTNGYRNDLCQALIEVQSKSEESQAKAAVVLIGVVLVAAIASAFLIDPLQ